jgi:AraC-like DNA-binding protein
VLESTDLEEVRAGVAGVLNDHRLASSSPAVRARLYAKGCEHVKVCLLEYGGAVSVETQPAADFLIVQSAVRGCVNVDSAAGSWTIRPGCGVILPSAVALKLDWEVSALQILVKIPLARLEGMYETLVGHPLASALEFRSDLQLDTAAGAGWTALVNHYCEQVEHADTPAARMRARLAEEALMGHLLCSYVNGMDDDLDGARKLAPRLVRRAREYIESHLAEPISLADIAQAAGASARSLSRAYQEYYGISPMASARLLRLERVHAELEAAGGDASVSDIAFRWGCMHLGRFATAYRERFGQAPHETLKRGRAIAH